jgi:hypothetical protein
MRTLLVLFFSLMLAGTVGAQENDDIEDEETNLERTAKLIRSGDIMVEGELSMDYREGRFHTIHVDLMGLDCGSCHYGERYRDDYMLLRHDEELRKRAKGQASRQTCLACHQVGGFATTYFMERPGEKVESAVKQ